MSFQMCGNLPVDMSHSTITSLLISYEKQGDQSIVGDIGFFISLWYWKYGRCLQVDGSFPEDMDFLKSLVNPGAMLQAIDFSMVVEISSGPFAFDVSRRSVISSSEHSRSSERCEGSRLQQQKKTFIQLRNSCGEASSKTVINFNNEVFSASSGTFLPQF